MIHFSRTVAQEAPSLFSSARKMIQSSQQEEMCTILAKTALGHDSSAPPSYVMDYRKACELRATEQFDDAKELYEKALQGAQNQGCSKDRISLITQEINLVEKEVTSRERRMLLAWGVGACALTVVFLQILSISRSTKD